MKRGRVGGGVTSPVIVIVVIASTSDQIVQQLTRLCILYWLYPVSTLLSDSVVALIKIR